MKLIHSDEAKAPTPATGRDIAGPPTRLVARFMAEVNLAALVGVMELLEQASGRPAPLDRAVVLMVVMRASLQLDRVSTDAGAGIAEDAPDASISVNAIAASLSRPFETIRRHVNGLVADGICVRTKRGITLNSSGGSTSVSCLAARRVHDLMVRAIDYVRLHGISPPAARSDQPYQPKATAVAALDMILAAAEYLHPHYEDWLEMFTVNAVLAANARPITFDPELALRYATHDNPPPASLRVPVAVADIARALRVPYSTLQRQANRSIERGQLLRVTGGVIISETQVTNAAVRVAGPIATARAMRAFGRLAQGGFRFHDPVSCYLEGPPPLLDFGAGQPKCLTDRPVTPAAPDAGN